MTNNIDEPIPHEFCDLCGAKVEGFQYQICSCGPEEGLPLEPCICDTCVEESSPTLDYFWDNPIKK